MDKSARRKRSSRIPNAPYGSLTPETSASSNYSISDQGLLLNTEDFLDISNQADAAANAIMNDIGKGRESDEAVSSYTDAGPSETFVNACKWRGGSKGPNPAHLGIPHLGKGMGLLDMDNESVLTVGSCEGGDNSGVSYTHSIEAADIVRLSGWNRTSQLEDIQSVGSGENGNLDTARQIDDGSETPSSFGPSSDEDTEAVHGASMGVVNSRHSRLWSPRSGSLGSARKRHSGSLSTRLSDGSDDRSRQPHSARGIQYSQDLFPDIAVSGKVHPSPREQQSYRSIDSQHGVTPTAAHLELASVLKDAEGEVAELKRQVLQKNRDLEMAQAALVEYEDEVQKLYKRLQNTGNHCKTRDSQHAAISELERVKSDTANLANQVSQMLDFVPAIDGGSGSSGLESLKLQNLELARQLQTSVHQEDVEHLETELLELRAERDSLSRELNLFKDDKRRLQSELLLAQEELMCVLSETNDADEEVQVYLHRLKESQSKQEMLERDLKRTENDLQNLQQENMQLKAEARAWKAHSEGNVDSSALQAMNDEMERTRSQLTQALQENAQLREELIGLQEISHGDGDDPEDSSKVVQLREALTVALQVNEYLKARQEEVEEECETDRKWEEYPAAQQVEQMQEMLDLALEANQLLEERAEENAEVSAGLRYLASEVVALEADMRERELDGAEDMRRRADYVMGTDALVVCNEQYLEEITKIRDALGRALEVKSDLEGRLDRKNHVVQELLARIDKLEQLVEGGAGKATSSAPQVSTRDAQVADDDVTITSELRHAVENSDGETLRDAALHAVARLEGIERQLVNALQDKAKLAERLSGITIASAELEKVMKEDVKSGGAGNPEIQSSPAGPEPSRGSNAASDDDASESAQRALKKGDSKGSSSGGRSSRTVTISAVQFRNLRREIRELTAEKEQLQEQCESNKGREAGFYAELQKLQEELAGALQHKASLARQFREFGHVRERLLAEVEALKEALDEEQLKANEVEDALEDFRSLHVDLLSVLDSGAEIEDDEIPVYLPDCIRFWASKVREDMVQLVSSSSLHATNARQAGRDSPSLANVVVSAQAHTEIDEPQPSPSRRSNQDSQSHMMTVLKNDVRDLRDHVDAEDELGGTARLDMTDDIDEDLRQEENVQARCQVLQGARRQLEDVIGSKPTTQDPGSRGLGEDWDGEEGDSIYGDYAAEGLEAGSFDRHGQQDLHHSLQVNDYLNRMEQQVMMQGQEVHKEHQNFGDHHQQINGGRHLIDMDQPLRGYNDESSGPRSELPEDLNFRTSFQDVLLNLESEIEQLRQKKLTLSPPSREPNSKKSQPLTRELSQKISDLQGWADEIEAALMRKAEDLEADFEPYQPPDTLIEF